MFVCATFGPLAKHLYETIRLETLLLEPTHHKCQNIVLRLHSIAHSPFQNCRLLKEESDMHYNLETLFAVIEQLTISKDPLAFPPQMRYYFTAVVVLPVWYVNHHYACKLSPTALPQMKL